MGEQADRNRCHAKGDDFMRELLSDEIQMNIHASTMILSMMQWRRIRKFTRMLTKAKKRVAVTHVVHYKDLYDGLSKTENNAYIISKTRVNGKNDILFTDRQAATDR